MGPVITAAGILLLAQIASADATVTYATTADWQTEFTGQITIVNNGPSAVQNWVLQFDFAPSILSIWDAQISQHNASHYVVISAGWNNTIAAGGSVIFGFSGSPGNVNSVPQNVKFTATAVPSNSTPLPLSISVAETSEFNNQFSAVMTIINSGSAPFANWTADFNCDQQITAISGADLVRTATGYEISGPSIPAGGQLAVSIKGAGALDWNSFSNCTLNGAPCQISITSLGGQSANTPSIFIAGIDTATAALQVSVSLGPSSYKLSLSGGALGKYSAVVSNSDVLSASVDDSGELHIVARATGRAGIKIQDSTSGATRFLGVRVNDPWGSPPRLPKYLALGTVSEDTSDDLGFLEDFQPDLTNRRVDIRYIYLNGGPINGWDTWGNGSGSRAVTFIRNSRMLGVIPFFVFYNIPDSSEGYQVDLQHVQDAAYMAAYFKNLKLALDLINQESPDDMVGIILEPDFIGYLAQNANQPASAITAITSAAYSSGVLSSSDPLFPNTVQGLVQAINYTISKFAPQVFFGWQMNLWASPAGGFTTSVPNTGLMHKTDALGVATGRPLIYNEASAITRYYLSAGIASYGAGFVSIDKYGLDATGFQASAAQDPADSVWFWNNDQWQNYLTFVRAMHDTSKLPVILWQLPVGHINSSLRKDPYASAGTFPDLMNSNRSLEDSSSTFFFGDSFTSSGARLAFFSKNDGKDPKVSVSGQSITWGEHLSDSAAAGVIAALFGAGVGASTTNIGTPPTDSYWWITAAQSYYARPAGILRRPPRHH
ncbi:MAG TPA: cellulose binding domain-containing protein [Bryobacteraceae bacterium]|nr:cellulose binding domain-containing protein [Bryobacteraceae bacterium]